jgi:putative MATE family efflux protein
MFKNNDGSSKAGGLKRQLGSLAIPIFIETLLMMTLGAVDTFMLSRHSDVAVAAVGVVNQIVMLCFLVFEVINLGTSVLVSQYIGAGLKHRVSQVVGVSLVVNLVVGVILSAGLYFGAENILKLMGLSDDILAEGVVYMRIVGMLAFFQSLSFTASATLRATNKAVYPMMVVAMVNVLNIFGNYTLIFGHFGAPALGVEGAAISTVISRGIAMVVLLLLLYRHVL